jgi:hypothetical protein
MKSSNWSILSSTELLKLRWKELNLNLNQSPIEFHLKEVLHDLKLKGFLFKPEFFISDAWYVSLNYTAIAIPYYLLHPRLIKLEQEIMGKIEGENATKLRRLIRHELGHSIDHAYKLQKNIERMKLFGSSNLSYPESYKPNHFLKKNYVQYLGQNYGSSHPDEDWAETFATWFDQRIHWRLRYPTGMTRKKLNFVNQLMNEIKGTEVLLNRSIKTADRLDGNLSLAAIYSQRLKEEKKFYEFDLSDLETILVNKEDKVKTLSSKDKIILGSLLSEKTNFPKDDVIQILNNLEIGLWRKGRKLKLENGKEQKILINYFAQRLSLYIGKEKNNILM